MHVHVHVLRGARAPRRAPVRASEEGRKEGRKEKSILIHDVLNTFYLRSYGVVQVGKEHSDSEGSEM